MTLWKWIVGRLSVTEGIEKWRAIYHGGEDGMSANDALKLSAWWSAVRLKTETIATLPFGFFQTEGESRKPLRDYFLQTILHDSPNAEQTPVEWWQGRVGPLCTQGNSFAEKSYIGNRIVALLPMPFDQVTVFRRKSDNELRYKFVDRGKTTEFPADKVFHIKGFTPNDEDMGLSPVEYAMRSLTGARATELASKRVYSRGMRAQGFFAAPAEMTKDQRKQFQENYVEPGEGPSGEGKSLIFPPGFDWKNMGITPRDAEIILSRGFNVEDICRWQRVPPILVGHASAGQTMFGTGVEQVILGWLVLGLRAELRTIESAVNTRLIPLTDRRNGISFEFNFEGLLRADSAARAQLFAQLAQNGLRTRNELRQIDHYEKIDGADELTVQSNLIPLDKLGETPPTQTAAPSPTETENAEQLRNIWRLLQERK